MMVQRGDGLAPSYAVTNFCMEFHAGCRVNFVFLCASSRADFQRRLRDDARVNLPYEAVPVGDNWPLLPCGGEPCRILAYPGVAALCFNYFGKVREGAAIF